MTGVGVAHLLADYATLQVKGLLKGNVNFNGHTSRLQLQDTVGSSSPAQGMQGTLDFGKFGVPGTNNYGAGTLEVGNNINLTFGATGISDIKLLNADQATLVFTGGSNINGVIGSATPALDHSTPLAIYVGSGGNTVTFNNDIYVGSGKLNIGSGTVNVNGKLIGALAFGGMPSNAAGSGSSAYPGAMSYGGYGGGGSFTAASWSSAGTVNVGDGSSVTNAITTSTNGQGTVNFLGAISTQADIGTSQLGLKAVTFNSAGNNKAVFIANNVYASTVTIGNGSDDPAANATNATFLNSGLSFGGSLVLANRNTTLNVGATRNTVGGEMVTNNATLNFSLAPDENARFSVLDQLGSGKLTASTLTVSGSEKIGVTAVGSLRNGASYNLISANTVNGSLNGALVSSNSYVVDMTVSTSSTASAPLMMAADPGSADAGDHLLTVNEASSEAVAFDADHDTDRDGEFSADAGEPSLMSADPVMQTASPSGLVLTVNRANNSYVTKSNTQGHFSNNAATALGTIAANGTQVGDMVSVLKQLDLNEYGYGNNAVNLAQQVKQLPPVANGSLGTAAFVASSAAGASVNDRLLRLRYDGEMRRPVKSSAWAKVYGGTLRQNSSGQYDGYQSKFGGVSLGGDGVLGRAVIGGALSFTNTALDQKDFRVGDSATVNSYQLSFYGTHDFDRAYLEGTLLAALHDTKSHRHTIVGRTAEAKYNAKQFGLHLGAGYRFIFKPRQMSVTPLLGLEGDWLKQPSYTETGAGAVNLVVDNNNRKRLLGMLGVRLSAEFQTAKATYIPELTLKYAHDFASKTQNITARFSGGGDAFTTPALTEDKRNSWLVSAGVSIVSEKKTSVQLQYDGEFKSGYRRHGGQLKALWAF